MAFLAIASGASAVVCAGLIWLLWPVLRRYALARPNARSSHTVPTPQGGGIAVIAATLAVASAALAAAGFPPASGAWALVAAMTLALAAAGAVDDIRPLSPLLRLVLQSLAVGVVVLAASGTGRLLPGVVPLWLERGLAVVAGALFGALIGFAPFNRPVARLFLGDVGSLPIGLLVAWMLYRLALDGGLAAALLLPLYYLADATITLLRRLMRGERVWEAHRTHFYQQATDRGLPVVRIAAHVLTVNVALAGLAGATLAWRSLPAQLAALALGGILVALVLARFAAPGGRRLPA